MPVISVAAAEENGVSLLLMLLTSFSAAGIAEELPAAEDEFENMWTERERERERE
jgi:hypothetical protein